MKKRIMKFTSDFYWRQKKIQCISISLLIILLMVSTNIMAIDDLTGSDKVSPVMSEQKLITGSVTDNVGQPLPGVTVMVKGTTQGTVTDTNGKFTLADVPVDAVLQFSFVSMKSQEIEVKQQSVINVVLVQETIGLDEVVAIGYGTMKKSDITGSVVSVNTEQMMKRAPISVAQGLQGMAAGVVVTQSSGDPNGGYNIRIRGVATMNGNTDPLWVVDGVQHGNNSNLSWLNPNDIENIEVLKDASATAIYGSRGANGVIMVTTKAGTASKLQVNLRTDFGISTMSNELKMANMQDWLTAYRTSMENDGKVPFTAFNGNYDDQLNYIDWQKQMTSASNRQQYHLSIAGGSKDMQANASIGYMDNQGIVVNSWNKRLTLNLNVQGNIKNVIRLGFTTNFSTSKGNSGGNQIDYARLTPTMDYVDPNTNQLVNVPVQYPDGDFGHFFYDQSVSNSAGMYASNPYADQYIRKYQDDWDNDNGAINNSAWIEFTLLKGLTFKSTVNYDFWAANSWYYNSPYISSYYVFTTNDGLDDFGTSGNANTNMGVENFLTYGFKASDHHFNLMVGQSASKSHGSSNGSSTRDLTFNFLRGFYSADANEYNNGSGGPNVSTRYVSYFGRFNYSYKNRYMVTATIRRDGSSKFGPGNRWGTFPSASFAWRASEEKFIKDLGIFSNLKLRAGWGQTGNANLNTVDAIPQLSTSGISYDFFNATNDYSQLVGLAQSREIDQFLKWEASEQTNIGLDLGILGGSLNVSLDYYVRDTKDLILAKAIRPSAGFSSIKTNFGSIRNKGFEFSVNYNKKVDTDWFFSGTLNGSTNKNEAVDIGTGTTSSGPTGSGWDDRQVCYNGLPLGTYQGYVVDHIIQDQNEIDALNESAVAQFGPGSYYDQRTTGPGDFLFKDSNGDGHITTDDKQYLGDGFVKLNLGINLQARYRNWDASIYMYGALGQKILSWAKNYMTRFGSADNSGYSNLLSEYANNSWSPDNLNSSFPKLSHDDLSGNTRVSDYYVEKGDYLKISNLQIGYTLNKNLFGNAISSARIYGSVQNLATISPYNKFGDPEVSSGVTTTGLDNGRYPFPRTFMFGVQVSF